MPKALLRTPEGQPFLRRAVDALFGGGCASVTVVLGAAASDARALLASDAPSAGAVPSVVVAEDYAKGISASLRAGLESLDEDDAAIVTLVDLMDVGPRVIHRLLLRSGPAVLARATYDRQPGHPVLIGRDHWAGVLTMLDGDRGAQEYLTAHGVVGVPCDDLATGVDADRPQDLSVTRPESRPPHG